MSNVIIVPSNMVNYRNWERKQTDFCEHIDTKYLDDWFILPFTRKRDSCAYENSNFRSALKKLGGEQEGKVEVHRFNHWACGWYEMILVNNTEFDVLKAACKVCEAFDDYPVVDEDDLSELEIEEADVVWRECYNRKERVKYMRENPEECNLDDRNFNELLRIARGEWFPGYASNIL